MSTQRVLGGMEETSEDTFGGILASDGVKRDSDSWDIDGIDCTEFLDNAFVDLEHEGPPVAAVDRLGKVTLSDGTRALAISCRWGRLRFRSSPRRKLESEPGSTTRFPPRSIRSNASRSVAPVAFAS